MYINDFASRSFRIYIIEENSRDELYKVLLIITSDGVVDDVIYVFVLSWTYIG